MALVAFPVPERQPAACPTCAKRQQYRANAAQHFAIFEAEFGTAGVSRRLLLVVFALHADKQLVESLLICAWYRTCRPGVSGRSRKSFNPRRCPNGKRCWLHHQRGRTTGIPTGSGAVVDA
jgi:hypothetical protein